MNGELIKYEEFYSKKIYSQFGEELGIQFLFRKHGPDYKGFYVDVGAYHPAHLSNTKWAYDMGWRGINIEPNLDNIALFQIYRPDDINICCGVSDTNGVIPYYRYKSPVRNSLSRGLEMEEVVPIPVRKLNDILEENHVGEIDFLDIDAEGYAERIIHSIDWERYKPICVLIEMLSEQKTHFGETDIHKFLIGKGYQFRDLFVKTLIYTDGTI